MKRITIIIFYIVGAILALAPFMLMNYKLYLEKVHTSSMGLTIFGIALLIEYYSANIVEKIFNFWAQDIVGLFLILLALTDFLPSPQKFIVYLILDILVVILLIYKRKKLQKELGDSWKNMQIGPGRGRK